MKSKPKHTIIYVTGLSDRNVKLQKIAVSSWRVFSINPILFQTNWADEKSFSEKLNRLIGIIDNLKAKGHKVSLIGASAGASMVIAANARRSEKVSGIAFICGKLRRPEAVGEQYYTENPSFRDAMKQLNTNVAKLNDREKAKIMSIAPLFDETVAKKDTYIRGVKNVVVPTLFHVPSIALCISIFSFIPIFFLKRNIKKGRMK